MIDISSIELIVIGVEPKLTDKITRYIQDKYIQTLLFNGPNKMVGPRKYSFTQRVRGGAIMNATSGTQVHEV